MSTETGQQERRKSSKARLLIRSTAAALAVIMILSIVLYSVSQVSMNVENYLEKDYRIAARELLKENEYASSSRISQMSSFARDLLSGRHTFEEVELGVQVSVAQGKFDEAIALTEQSISLHEGSDETKGKLYLRLGYLHVMQNEPENALNWLNTGIALAPSPEAYLTRAQVELELGMTEEALKDTDVYMATAENPEDMVADMVNIFEASGEFGKAAEMYSLLIERTGSSEYLLNRAYCYTNLGRMAEAAEDRDRYAAAGGAELGNADVMLGLGWMRAKDYVKADDCFVRATDENYGDPESLYYYVVLCSYMTQNYERVCTYGDRLAERIRNGNATQADITVEKRTGRLNVSLVKLDRASVYQMSGASHLALGHYDTAAERLTDCLAENPGDAYPNYLRGIALLALGRYGEAEADFTAAIAADTETERSYYSRAACREEKGDTAGALADYEWVVENGQDPELFRDAAGRIIRINTADSPKTPAPENNPENGNAP